MIKKEFWLLNLDRVLIDGKDSGMCGPMSRMKCGIIMDSGTSTFGIAAHYWDNFNRKLNAIGDEDRFESWPVITFVIDGVKYPLTGDNYLMVDGQIPEHPRTSFSPGNKLTHGF